MTSIALRPPLLLALVLSLFSSLAGAQVFVNEIHYDNSGTDSGEAIEIAAPAGTVLDGWSVVLYNGNGGSSYDADALSGTVTDAGGGFGFVVVDYPTNGIQNGAPDGIALVDPCGNVTEFLSYEGGFTAAGGPADGMTSTDIGVSESSGTAAGNSLQRAGNGNSAADFTFQPEQAHTFGAANTGQTFTAASPPADCGNGGGGGDVPALVINEIHADPDSSEGDANNDGTPHFSGDEFVEIVNVSGAEVDLSGFTLADGFTVRHTFPDGSVVADQCAVVIFGGGAPTGDFGAALAQTASSGSLGLNNGGDTITLARGIDTVSSVEYGSEGGDNQSLTRVPDLAGDFQKHLSVASTRYSPGRLADGTQFAGCEAVAIPVAEIFEIQGDGTRSPYEGRTVTTQNNVVTALAPNGFFMQTPADRSDGNVDTSDGIFVFTGGAAAVAVGDLVDVTGNIVEFFDFTEYAGGAEVTVTASGAMLPAAVQFDASVPSPNPAAPSCAIEFECYEGMLVEIASGTVTGPNQGFGSDPLAEVHIRASAGRAFREPGIEFPGLAGLPTWDGNPEVFELDPDKLGLPNRAINAGSTFSATGVIGYEFGGYELWPSSLVVDERALPAAVRSKTRKEITVGSLNLFRLFDDIDDAPILNAFGEETNDTVIDTAEYQRRLAKFADYIVNNMGSPDILAVQEVESLAVLRDLAAAIAPLDKKAKYRAFLEEGNDFGSIDVGFLVRKKVNVRNVTQLGYSDTYVEPDGDLDILHDRPPLLLEARIHGKGHDRDDDRGSDKLGTLYVLVVHNRSLGGIEGSSGDRVRIKRLEQAQSVAAMVQSIQEANPWAGLVVTGDFNGFEFSDGYVDVLGQVRGDVNPADNLLSGPDLVEPDLMNQLLSLPPEERYSFVFRGSAQALDHALTNRVLDLRVRGLQFARGNTDAAELFLDDASTSLGSSDHDGLVLYLYKGELDDDDDDDGDDDEEDDD